MYITQIHAREIFDSRGWPSLEAEVRTRSGIRARAAVPSGASRGLREALELRDGGQRLHGQGLQKAIKHITTVIAPALKNRFFADSAALDAELIGLDKSANKQHLGANAILATSQAALRAFAQEQGLPVFRALNSEARQLPMPMFNLINGGAHADNALDIQEFMILPIGAVSFREALEQGVEVFQQLKILLKRKGLGTNVGDEGGFAPPLSSHRAAIELLLEAVVQTGLRPGLDVFLCLDAASSEFYQNGHYHLGSEKKVLSSLHWLSYLEALVDEYPIWSIEDGMAEEDWPGWTALTERLKQIQLVGDDLFVTNTHLLAQGIKEGLANAILIKPNQIGTMTETQAAIVMAQNANYQTVMSHRSGETEDPLIADLAVAWQCPQIKAGGLCRSERLAKYNQLLRIEEELGSESQFAGPVLRTLFIK